MSASTRRPYYHCQRCTNCCRWPGDVHLTDADIVSISRFLGLAEWEFVQQHTKVNRRRTGLALHEHPDGTCVWLDGRDCRLQPAKPEQCRGFPNTWNFPGWRDMCEAIEVEAPAPSSPVTSQDPDS